MDTKTIIVILVVFAIVLWSIFFGGRLPQPFHRRNCQGKGWRRAFPTASKHTIREFLTLFVDAFAFSNNERLKLSPDDSIFQIYRALYPIKGFPDALELETLAKDLEIKYGLKLESIWHEKLTLGELFASVLAVHKP